MPDCIPCKSNGKISVVRTLKEAVRSAPRVARQVVNGMFVDIKTKAKRMDICTKCENFYPPTKRCTICTCYLDKKTVLACESCPIQKWGTVGNCEDV